MKDEDFCRLNGPANRILTNLVKTVKTAHNPLIPSVAQMRLDFSEQRSKPVALAGSANTGYPLAFNGLGFDTPTDFCNGGLKTSKITLRAQPYHAPTIRTPIPPQPKKLIIPIKICRHIPMSP
jgi:hypothetical protein